MAPETAAIVVAGIGGWATIIGGLMDLRKRTNGSGPIAGKLEELKEEVRDVKADVLGLKADFREHLHRKVD